MNEIKARINYQGELIEVGYIEGLKFTCTIPSDFIDRFWNYKPIIEGKSITDLSVIDDYIDWHDRESKIQIKIEHCKNTQLLIDYPSFSTFPIDLKLKVFTDDNYVYIYASFLRPEHEEILNKYATITKK